MKEIKQFSRSYILVSALYIVLGIVLVAWPTTSVQMICYGIGIGMFVLGITYGIVYFTKDNSSGFLQMDLVIGIVCLAFGIFLLLNTEFFMSVLPFAMGIILLLGAIVKIQSAVNMKRLKFRKWYIVLIAALVLIGLAVVLLCNLIKEEHPMILYIGICLVLDGLTNLTSLICIQSRTKKLARMQRKNPDVPYEQLLEDYIHRNDPGETYVPSTEVDGKAAITDAGSGSKGGQE